MAHANARLTPVKADPDPTDRRPTPTADRPHRPRDGHLPDHRLPLVGPLPAAGRRTPSSNCVAPLGAEELNDGWQPSPTPSD
jgi:hypothetical protein